MNSFLNTAFTEFHKFWNFVLHFHLVQNVYLFLRLLLWPICYLKVCGLTSKYLGNFRLSFYSIKFVKMYFVAQSVIYLSKSTLPLMDIPNLTFTVITFLNFSMASRTKCISLNVTVYLACFLIIFDTPFKSSVCKWPLFFSYNLFVKALNSLTWSFLQSDFLLIVLNTIVQTWFSVLWIQSLGQLIFDFFFERLFMVLCSFIRSYLLSGSVFL